ncbi:PHD finger protein 14-like [Orbicella faveolata]|uniref:PHD finger protein 14-like n=1 Tax=Orbicella faveolata TaxID=48498 RepID=UPI0009E25835|nr:PHD finger protein 14-like [Orbicella faveolata]
MSLCGQAMVFVNRQCSECDPSSNDEEMEVDPQDTTPISQGRQRRIIKEPTKFTPDKGESKKRKLNKTSLKRKPPAVNEGGSDSNTDAANKKPKVESSADSSAPRRGRRPGRRDAETAEKKKKPEDVRTECTTCKQSGTNANLVRCDNCKLCYHFHCLDPPVKANPKTRGYQWVCKDCDESEGESEDADEEDTSTADSKTERNMKQEKDVKQEGSEIHGQKTDGKKEKPNDIEQSSS